MNNAKHDAHVEQLNYIAAGTAGIKMPKPIRPLTDTGTSKTAIALAGLGACCLVIGIAFTVLGRQG